MNSFIRDALIKVVNLIMGFITIKIILLALPNDSYNLYNTSLSLLVLLNYADLGLIIKYRNFLVGKNFNNPYSDAQTRIFIALVCFLILFIFVGQNIIALALFFVGIRVIISIHSQWVYIHRKTHLIYISNLFHRILFLSLLVYVKNLTVDLLIVLWSMTYLVSGVVLINRKYPMSFNLTLKNKEWDNILPIVFIPLLSSCSYLLLESSLFNEMKRDSYSLFVRLVMIVLPFVNVYVYSNWSTFNKVGLNYQFLFSILAVFIIFIFEFLFFRDRILNIIEYTVGFIFLLLAFNIQLKLWLKFNS